MGTFWGQNLKHFILGFLGIWILGVSAAHATGDIEAGANKYPCV